MAFLSVITARCYGDSDNPVLKVHAYQREIVSGIPGSPPGKAAESVQWQYSIYLETNPTLKFEITGVWMDGRKYSVKSVVKPSPVKFDNPVVYADEERNIAVPKTENQVSEVIVKTPMPDKTVDAPVAQLLKENKAVVEITSGGKTIHVPVKAFQKRDPVFLR